MPFILQVKIDRVAKAAKVEAMVVSCKKAGKIPWTGRLRRRSPTKGFLCSLLEKKTRLGSDHCVLVCFGLGGLSQFYFMYMFFFQKSPSHFLEVLHSSLGHKFLWGSGQNLKISSW